MLSSAGGYPVPCEPDPPELKNPRNRHCKWRGWVNSVIIKRKCTDIENSGLKYFALFPNTSNNGWQLFELHTGKDAKGDSQVATLLGHDLQIHRNWLQLMPLTKEDKFSDKAYATFVFEAPDPDAFLINRGVEPGIVSLEPTGECFSEIEEDEASQKSTERMRSPIRTEAIGFLGLPFFRPNKMQVYNTTSRVLQLFVYDDENKTRSQVLMTQRSLLDFPSFVISLHLCSSLSLSIDIMLIFSSCHNSSRSLPCMTCMRFKRTARA
jgi:hypothetical protein